MQIGFQVKEYLTQGGKNPYREWLGTLDTSIQQRIQARVLRLESGNLGDSKVVGEGVFEARLDFGPGYRLYYGREGQTLVLLLCGGDKSTQRKDIQQAKDFWQLYRENKGA